MNFLNSINKKILLSVTALLLIMSIGISSVFFNIYKKDLLNEKEIMLKFLIDSSINIMDGFYERTVSGEITEQEAKTKARESIKNLLYGKNGYIFTFNYQGEVQIEFGSKKIGDNMFNVPDEKGNYFVRELFKVSQNGGGYYSYYYNNPETNKIEPKLSYAKAFEPWEWFCGTGVYINDVKDKTNAALTKIITLSLLFIIGAITLLYFISRSISNPASKAAKMMENIAVGEGDLTQRMSITSQDEIGIMAKWFNVFIEKVQNIIVEITEGTETLAASGTELHVIADEMNKGISMTMDKSNTVAAAAEEMSSNMDAVDHRMAETSEKLNTVSAGTEEMSSSINEIAENASKSTEITRNAVIQAEKATAQMEELGKAAQEIVKVTDTIAEISEQTNLLALNATIEAARAGDAGKGFAVVANEIKELARQTAEATDQIARQLNGVQQTSAKTAQEIEGITGIIDEIDHTVGAIAAAVEQQNATTSENSQGINEISGNIKEINENISQSTSASGQIAEEISDVNQSTNEMGNSAAQVKIVLKN